MAKPVTVFVTGGTGFIGQKCIKHLVEDGSDVRIIILTRKWIPSDENVTYIKGEISDNRLISKVMSEYHPDVMLHLAWNVKNRGYEKNDENIEWVKWSRNTVQTFLENGGRNLICSGTCFEYDSSGRELIKESSVCRPNTLYGACKLKLYDELEELCRRYKSRFVWGRVFYPYGPGEEKRKFITNVIETLERGNRFVCSAPGNVADYIHVNDVANIFCRFTIEERFSGIYNVCTGEKMSIKQIVETIAERLGKKQMIDCSSEDGNSFLVGDRSRLDEAGLLCNYDFCTGLETYFK